ncbi:hydrolase [Caballeronia sp. LP006]|uniref:HAD family hydrolase n=1 Tax=Caballeronia sp. LP006 TaxID=3038552 RepID=UPI0028582CC9|nr:hydrolase [Caballeronia sp. LP006]MDR5831976.1 hydrolase [Caballeronia sp. LP006]
MFDTLFLRPLSDPEDLFDIIGEKHSIAGFKRLRREAQAKAFQRMQRDGKREITLDGIYDCLDELPVPASQLRDEELQLELALTIPNPRLIDVFKETLAQKRVVITSDMYLPRAFFDELFRRHGLQPPALFISSERNATKRDVGELFDIVANDLDVEHACLLHIGDNAISDIERAKEKGLATYHYVDWASPVKTTGGGASASLASNLYRVLERAPARGTFAELGFRFGGPAATGFLDWIARKSREDRIDLILFVSRDGHILERLASSLGAGQLPEYAYFKGSRVAFTMAATDDANFDSQIDFFLAGSHGLKPFEVLERIGIEPPADSVMDDLGLGAATTVSDANMSRMRDFLSAYRATILQACRRNRRGLLQYLIQAGVKPGMRVAMVDVGWNGTTQEALDMALAKLMDVQLYGYYLCLNESKECLRRKAKLRMDALFSNASIGASRVTRVYENRVAVELFFSAPHDAVIGYQPSFNGSVGVIEDPGRSAVDHHAQVSIEIGNAIADFDQGYRALCRTIGVKPDPLATAIPLADFVERIDQDALRLLSSVENFDAWGSSRNQRVALSTYIVT